MHFFLGSLILMPHLITKYYGIDSKNNYELVSETNDILTYKYSKLKNGLYNIPSVKFFQKTVFITFHSFS